MSFSKLMERSTRNAPGRGRAGGLAFLAWAVALVSSLPWARAQDGGGYQVGAGDLLQVDVFLEAELSGSYRVSATGALHMPVIGVVDVGGRSERGAAAAVRAKLLDGYILDPQVTVRVVEYAQVRFTVLGQVRDPKTYAVDRSESVTLLQAIGMAGGFTRLANERRVTVKRRVGGEFRVMRFDAKEMARDGGDSEFRVRDGDIIRIEESPF